jgi:hypothetical protein
LACEQLLEGEAEQLIRKLVEKAKQGDIYALRLCVERILPARKERCINLELRPTKSAQDLPFQFQDITAAIAEGRITPGEGESMSNILTSHARTMEVVELERRVAELEALKEEVISSRRQLREHIERETRVSNQEVVQEAREAEE